MRGSWSTATSRKKGEGREGAWDLPDLGLAVLFAAASFYYYYFYYVVAVLSVPWPCETRVLVKRIEAALAGAPAAPADPYRATGSE